MFHYSHAKEKILWIVKKISLRDSDHEFIINEIGGSKVNIHIDYTDGGILRRKLYKPGSETRNL